MSSAERQSRDVIRYSSLLVAAALLERSYRLALDIQSAGGASSTAAELVDLLDDARVALLAAGTPRKDEQGGPADGF